MKHQAYKAFIFSLLLPGAGQFYSGTYARGIFWFIVGLMSWLIIGAYAVACHLISAVMAYNYVARKAGQDGIWPDI